MLKTFAHTVVLVGALAGFSAASFASAQVLSPARAQTIDLGAARGSAYFVARADGYHLVATLLPSGGDTPVRFQTILAKGQSASVSVPGRIGANAQEVTFSRPVDAIVVVETPAAPPTD